MSDSKKAGPKSPSQKKSTPRILLAGGAILLVSVALTKLIFTSGEDAAVPEVVAKAAAKSSAIERLRATDDKNPSLPSSALADTKSQEIQAAEAGATATPVATVAATPLAGKPTVVSEAPPIDAFSAAMRGEKREAEPTPMPIPEREPPGTTKPLVRASLSTVGEAQERSARMFLAKTGGKAPELRDESAPKSRWGLADLAQFTAPKTQILSGREQTSGEVGRIKRGTRVLCRLEDALLVNAGEEYATSCAVTGVLNAQSFPSGITVLGKATLDKAENGVLIAVEACINSRSDQGEISCRGEVKDLWGRRALTGDRYSATGWAILARTARSLLSTYILSQMSTSATISGIVMDQTASNQVRGAFGSAVTKASEEIAKSFDRTASSITLAGGSIVQVEFTQTTDLW